MCVGSCGIDRSGGTRRAVARSRICTFFRCDVCPTYICGEAGEGDETGGRYQKKDVETSSPQVLLILGKPDSEVDWPTAGSVSL
jgi:hypothetical protein